MAIRIRMFAGPNGSGKSDLIQRLQHSNLPLGPIFNVQKGGHLLKKHILHLKFALLSALFIIFLQPKASNAQENRLINTHSWQYEYIQRLQQRGHLLQLNPTDLPYAFKDVRNALSGTDSLQLNGQERRWYGLLEKSFTEKAPNADGMRIGGVFKGSLRHSSSERLDVDNPLGDGKAALPRAQLMGYMEWENWIGQSGLTFDLFYDVDPDGLDVVRHLYTRSEETYLGYNGDLLDVYVGRFDNHWSQYGRQGGFLTDNPRSFDQIQIKFGSPTISFSSIYGQLGSMKEDGTFNEKTVFSPGGYRRFVFLHRLDWSVRPNLKLSFLEGELYSSQTAGISLRSLLPFHFLYFSSQNAPIDNYINLLVGGSVWYQTGPMTFFAQGMIDEIILNQTTIDKRKENNTYTPPKYTINSTLTITNIGNTFDLGLEADLVGSNTYRNRNIWEQWSFARRGLATNFSDYIRTKAYLTFYPRWLEGLTLEPGLTLYSKGEADFRVEASPRNPDGTPIPSILSGTVEQTVRPSLYLRYQPLRLNGANNSNSRLNFWIDADMGINFTENTNNIQGARSDRFIGLFRVAGDISF
jgi:hypothetical protein